MPACRSQKVGTRQQDTSSFVYDFGFRVGSGEALMLQLAGCYFVQNALSHMHRMLGQMEAVSPSLILTAVRGQYPTLSLDKGRDGLRQA